MVIDSSYVNLSSDRRYASLYSQQSASLITTAAQAATLDFSREGMTLMEQMQENREQLGKGNREQTGQDGADQLKRMAERLKESGQTGPPQVSDEYEMQVKLLRKLLAALNRGRGGAWTRDPDFEIRQYKASRLSAQMAQSYHVDMGRVVSGTGVRGGAGTVMARTTVTSAFFSEVEHTAFTGNGVARTADGREINFQVQLEMSRAFCKKYESLSQQKYIMTDPLVINLEGNAATVTDQKFLFDLDADGKEEEISFAGKGSGFLALDKNGDGKINDGTELFGTASGDGFADLAAYDKDGNGWIDEADDVFGKLRVWTKDGNGQDKLVDLKSAGIGAIYLGSASTQFSLNEMESNQTNGVIRRTGIYLKENGGVGTVQHVDLAV